jgi:hypothetical protein
MASEEEIFDQVATEQSPLRKKELEQQLKRLIEHLLLNDFERLVWILYKVDIDELKLKQLLKEQSHAENSASSPAETSQIITDLIISRQREKADSRKRFSKNEDIDENEKW